MNSPCQHRENVVWASVFELMATLDLDLRIQWANRAAGEAVNAEPDDLVGRHCYEVWHGMKSACADCLVLRTNQTSEPHKKETRIFKE